jgi:hypothetical protein
MVSVDKTYETYDMINRFMNVTPYLSEQAPKVSFPLGYVDVIG